MAANGTLKSSLSLPREKGPLGQNASSLPLASSHREEHRITTNLNTHSGDEILKYMQSDVSCNTGNDEASDSQVSSSITSIQDAIAEMLTNIRASTRQSEESSGKSQSSDGSKTKNNKDRTTERSNAKATDLEKTSDKGNKIKRPMNAFMVWAREYRQVLSKGFPKESNSQISVRLGDIWSNLTSEEKQPFYDKADRLRRQHEKDYPDWVYQPNKRRRTTASFPQTENRVVMATAEQIRGVLNSGNLGQNFQVQISPPIKTGQVHQPTKNQASRQISGLPQAATQQVKSTNISQSQPVSTSGPVLKAGPQFQSPKRQATDPVNESPLAADKFHSLLSRYPMAKVLGQLSPEPQKRRSKSTFKHTKKQQPIKAKTPQQTKTRKKGKKPSPEKAPSKKVVHIRPTSSIQEPTTQAQRSWVCSSVPIGGVQTLVYSPYPTAVASMQVQNHAVPLLPQGQPIVQIPAPSQFATAPPPGFMNMQRLPQQSTPRAFYHGNVMSPVSVVHRFPDPLTIRPDYSQPPPPLAIPVQPGVMMNMYPTRPMLPIMRDFKPTPHFPGQEVAFGPRLNISNNKNNSNSEVINAQNIYSNKHSNNNTNNSNIVYTNTNINGNNNNKNNNDTSSVNNAQKVFNNSVNNTSNAINNTKSKFSNINTTSHNIIYTNINTNGHANSSNNAHNIFNNDINNTTNVSNNNDTTKSKLRSTNDTNNRNNTNTATIIESNTNCSKNEQNVFSNTVNSTTNLRNNNTSNIKSSNESTNNSNIIHTNININGNASNISSTDNAQKALSNIVIGKINTSSTNTNISNCSNIITNRTYNSSSNNVQNVFSNTVNDKTDLSNNTNNNNRSNSNNSRSYSISSINNARDVFKNTVNSTTNVGKSSTMSSSNNNINNNTVISTANASSNSNNCSTKKFGNLSTISNNYSNANIVSTSNKKASNKDNTNNNFVNINTPSQSHNTVNCMLDENKIGVNTTMRYRVQSGITAQGSEVYTAAKQGETCNQSDNWMLQPPTNPSTVRPNWNLNSQERDEKLNIIVKLEHGDESAVVQNHHSTQTKEIPAASEFSKPSGNSACLAPLPPKKSFLQTLNTPMSSTDVVNQLTQLIRPPPLPYGATKKIPATQAGDDSTENMYKPPMGVPAYNLCDSAHSTKLPEPCPTGSSARILVQSLCEPTRLAQTSNLLQSETSPREELNCVSNNDGNFPSTIDHGNSVFHLTDYQSIPKKTQDSDPRPAEMDLSVPSSTSVTVLSPPNLAVCQQGGIIYINDSFSPASLKKDGVPHHLLQSSYSSSSSDSSFQLPDHMKPIDLSIVSIDSDNSIQQGCEKFLLDMDSKEILVNTQGWDTTRCEVAKQGVELGDKKMLVQLKKVHENFIGTVGGQLSPDDEVGS